MRAAALLPVLLLAAAPAAAQMTSANPADIVGVPAGCVPTLSVLDASCFWHHEMTCAGDPAGTRRLITPHADGAYFALTDAEGQWLEFFDTWDGVSWTLADNPSPVSISALLATGRDSFDFSRRGSDGSAHRVAGEDRLTGETVTVDGRAFQVLEYEYRVTDAGGALLTHVRGTNLVSADPPAYYGGVEEDLLGANPPYDSTPTDFVAPGEPGFLSAYAPQECLDALAAQGTAP